MFFFFSSVFETATFLALLTPSLLDVLSSIFCCSVVFNSLKSLSIESYSFLYENAFSIVCRALSVKKGTYLPNLLLIISTKKLTGSLYIVLALLINGNIVVDITPIVPHILITDPSACGSLYHFLLDTPSTLLFVLADERIPSTI